MKIGIIGAGQLGRMLALAGYPLGLRFVFLDHSADAPGGQVGEIIVGDFADRDRIAQLAEQVELLTYDVENVPAELIETIAVETPFLPPPAALATAQDRLHEKRLFRALGIDTPEYRPVERPGELERAMAELGLPCVLKTRRLGYDGRGQAMIRETRDAPAAFERLGGVPLILERFVEFEREISVLGARSTRGETAYYPIAENVHEDGILIRSLAPHEDDVLQEQAQEYLLQVMEHFSYAGVLTIEFFVTGGKLLANELAPRVHNSGHWTIEGCVTSQFENHMRAILGLPLGATEARGHAAMVNFIGKLPDLAAVLRVRGAHYHDYGKAPRPGRKLGHCTVTAADAAQRDRALEALLRCIAAG